MYKWYTFGGLTSLRKCWCVFLTENHRLFLLGHRFTLSSHVDLLFNSISFSHMQKENIITHQQRVQVDIYSGGTNLILICHPL